jgi:hypothetical protein
MSTQAAEALIEEYGIEVEVTGVGTARSDEGWDHSVYVVKVNGVTMPVPYRAGMALNAPTPAQALLAYINDASSADQSYPSWCGEYGMSNTDANFESWQQCQKLRVLFLEMFGPVVFDALAEVEW